MDDDYQNQCPVNRYSNCTLVSHPSERKLGCDRTTIVLVCYTQPLFQESERIILRVGRLINTYKYLHIVLRYCWLVSYFVVHLDFHTSLQGHQYLDSL
jgi:hypothetical protein